VRTRLRSHKGHAHDNSNKDKGLVRKRSRSRFRRAKIKRAAAASAVCSLCDKNKQLKASFVAKIHHDQSNVEICRNKTLNFENIWSSLKLVLPTSLRFESAVLAAKNFSIPGVL
tara:strand:- start:1003 stop:1344 length:342 start_codon:yes stop_codon:yes gene_type:complete